jgi:hypothetical protein
MRDARGVCGAPALRRRAPLRLLRPLPQVEVPPEDFGARRGADGAADGGYMHRVLRLTQLKDVFQDVLGEVSQHVDGEAGREEVRPRWQTQVRFVFARKAVVPARNFLAQVSSPLGTPLLVGRGVGARRHATLSQQQKFCYRTASSLGL